MCSCARAPTAPGHIELNADILPRVLVNRTYYATVTKKARDPAEKSFLVDCLATANWLTKSLDQRAQTILKVAAEIVKQQDGFLTHGVTHLRPMTLRLVADAIEMHESTVSRVTSNKYVSTPRGLFEMKYFFTTALGSTSTVARTTRLKRCATASGRWSRPKRRPTSFPTIPSPNAAEGAGDRSGAPHGGQIPRGDEHPVLGHPPAPEAHAGRRPIGPGSAQQT